MIGRGSIEYVLDLLGMAPESENDSLVVYQSRHTQDLIVTVDFSRGEMPLEDFRQGMLFQGIDQAVLNAALEQIGL